MIACLLDVLAFITARVCDSGGSALRKIPKHGQWHGNVLVLLFQPIPNASIKPGFQRQVCDGLVLPSSNRRR